MDIVFEGKEHFLPHPRTSSILCPDRLNHFTIQLRVSTDTCNAHRRVHMKLLFSMLRSPKHLIQLLSNNKLLLIKTKVVAFVLPVWSIKPLTHCFILYPVATT